MIHIILAMLLGLACPSANNTTHKKDKGVVVRTNSDPGGDLIPVRPRP